MVTIPLTCLHHRSQRSRSLATNDFVPHPQLPIVQYQLHKMIL